jgi:hypothetical protein
MMGGRSAVRPEGSTGGWGFGQWQHTASPMADVRMYRGAYMADSAGQYKYCKPTVTPRGGYESPLATLDFRAGIPIAQFKETGLRMSPDQRPLLFTAGRRVTHVSFQSRRASMRVPSRLATTMVI